jgi:hypothetical protein
MRGKAARRQRYGRLISVDLILGQLLTPTPDVYGLDRGVQNRHYQLCRTLEELQTVLPDATRDGRPAFVFTQPQDVHLANVAIDPDARSATPSAVSIDPMPRGSSGSTRALVAS